MRKSGKSFGYIIDNTSFTDAVEVARAIKAYGIELSQQAELDRQAAIDMELARLDALQDEAWQIMETETWKYNKDGDAIERDYSERLKAIETVLKIMKQRAELLGLNTIDPTEGAKTIVLIQGEQRDYVNRLKEIVQAG